MKPEKITRARPAWQRQEGESWSDWDKRRIAENTAELLRHGQEIASLKPLRTGSLGLAVGVGTYDANGNPKGQNWW